MKTLTALLAGFALSLQAADFRIETSTVMTSTGDYHWSQSRPAVIPGVNLGNPQRVIIVMQQIEKRGSHGYRDIFITETINGGTTWSSPQPIEALRRKRYEDGIERVFGDICPQWHAATKKLLVTGKCFGFLTNPNDNKAKDDRSQERVAYAVYSPETQQWSEMKIMAMPEKDHAGNPIIEPNAGCNQRTDLPNGDVLLPVRYRADPKSRVYTTVVARCTFDGETLTYREHGSEHTITPPRGLYEPSVCEFQGRYFLTMRAENNGHVARGRDGIHYDEAIEWKFDDGQPLGSANAQQHWITRGEGLYLTYSRRGANNDHVFRNRAPIFIARVDPEKLHILRATEQVLLPETGLDLASGFGSVSFDTPFVSGKRHVVNRQTWVVCSELAFPKGREDEPNRVLLARIFSFISFTP